MSQEDAKNVLGDLEHGNHILPCLIMSFEKLVHASFTVRYQAVKLLTDIDGFPRVPNSWSLFTNFQSLYVKSSCVVERLGLEIWLQCFKVQNSMNAFQPSSKFICYLFPAY